jgi:hypothetical protein
VSQIPLPSHEEIHTGYEQGEEVIVALFEKTLSKLVDRIQALEDQIVKNRTGRETAIEKIQAVR